MSDIVVIGGGMAGVSAAAHLAPHGSVTLLEQERTLSYHTTGRSAALYVTNYGSDGVRPMSHASHRFLSEPPDGLVDGPLLTPRGLLWVAGPPDESSLDDLVDTTSERLDPDAAVALVPGMRADWVTGGLYEPDARDVDVAGLHQAFVRLARRHRAVISTGATVTGLARHRGRWRVSAGGDTYECDIVVNASGAWGDAVAAMAGVSPVGLEPKRRTAFMVPGSDDFSRWPMVVEAGQSFYFKPDGPQLLCSLAEESPSEPEDSRPRIEDVALAIDRINEATTLGIRSVNSQWTGLRTFAPDREMVIGPEPGFDGFYWLVGLGGTGIQTAPAYGQLIAASVTGSELPPDLVEAGVDPAVTDPARFR